MARKILGRAEKSKIKNLTYLLQPRKRKARTKIILQEEHSDY